MNNPKSAMHQISVKKNHPPRFKGKWCKKPLVDLAAITMGQSPPSMFYNLRGEGLPLIQGNADIEDRRTIDRVWTTRASKHCEIGDLLITVRAPVGFAAVASKWACLGRGVCGLKPFGDPSFLFHALVHAEDRWQRLEQGSTFTAANSEQVGQFQLDVPEDETEQRAIAEVLSDVDGLIGALGTLIAKKRAIKQATMQQLLSGKTRLPGFGGAWFEKPLIDLATITMGQSPPSMSYNQRGNGVPLIQGNADIKDRRTIDRVWTTQGSKYCDLGDLILTVRAPVGVVAVASKRACLGRGVCGLKPFGDSRFLFYALNNVQVRWQIFEQGSTFTAANSEQIGQFRLYLPHDENEQRAIADIFSDMDAEIAALAQRRDKTRAIKRGMMQQLLTGRVRLVRSDAATV